MLRIFEKSRAKSSRTTDHLNLLLCGAQRCGTSSLKHYLSEHPEIGFVNETDLTVDGRYYGYPFASPTIAEARVGEDPETYRAISRRLGGKKAYIATKQPYFMVHPHVPFNLREHIPDVRLLFVLRNPVDAAYSAYRNGLSKGRRTGSFEEAIKASRDAAALVSDPSQRGSWSSFFRDPEQVPLLIDRGFYYQQLIRFYCCLPEEQILVLRFDEFTGDTPAAMRRILGFLGLEPDFAFERTSEVKNAAPTKQPIEPETRAMLQEIYADSNRKLLRFLGWPEDLWDA
jgi:hypothetical protein